MTATLGPVSIRFALGVVLPTLALAVWIALVVATGHGKEWAPATLLIASLFVIPAVMLANCYVLFVAWKNRTRLLLAGLALPVVVALCSLVFVHGTPQSQKWSAFVLAPLHAIPHGVLRHPRAALVLWLLAIAVLLGAARARSRAGHEA